eukprot:m.197041 g.197041  ORF g.197041 m.197041 type:complete len:376 (+) comp32644_c0_seq2:149-1276(+)
MVEPKILSIQFNQDQGCFALGTEAGYSIWNSEPIAELCRRDVGGVRHVCLLQRTSIVALVGGGRNPFDSPNKVVLWDDVEGKSICHMEFRLPVLAVRRRTNAIVISTLNKIYVYKFNGLESSQFAPPVLIDTIHTTDNPKGLLCMNYNSTTTKTTLAFPAYTVGHAYIMGLRLGSKNSTSTSTAVEATSSKSKPLVTVKAHKSALAALSLSGSGNMLATVSVTGTLVRVFDVTTCEQLFSFRRGIASAEVDCISFNRNETMICGVFDQTMYLFKLAPDTGKSGGGGGLVSLAEQYFPRFEQTTSHSLAHVHIPSENSVCVFQNDKAALLAVCFNGTARKYRHHDRNIQTSEFHKLLKDNGDSLLKLLRAPEPHRV